MSIVSYLCVGLGGFLGAIGRYYLSSAVVRRWPQAFPWGTLTVNQVGSFLLGVFVATNINFDFANTNIGLAISAGFLGAFTTFATLSYELVSLSSEGKIQIAVKYLFSSLVLGLISFMAGFYLVIFIT